MKEYLIAIRNWIIRFLYKTLVKRILFLTEPEVIHDRTIRLCRFFGKSRFGRGLVSIFFNYSHPFLKQNILGIKFPNPIGLAAGFDKDALLADFLPSLGFGFAEVGSITGEPCEGNPKPRLWRLKKSQALVIYYGLKNEGCEKISALLKNKKFTIPIGTSIAKTNCQATAETQTGINDYVKAFKHFTDIGSYFTVNISCPNAFGGQPFTDGERLNILLAELDKIATPKPIFLKMSPDLTEKEVDAIVEVAQKHRVNGFICTNLTKLRDNKKIKEEKVPENGGISGKVLEDSANRQISYIYSKTRGKYVIIGCGGVFSAQDAYKKIRSGASLVQLITGMIFEGPQLISEINQGLVRLLKKDGFNQISQAVGVDNKF